MSDVADAIKKRTWIWTKHPAGKQQCFHEEKFEAYMRSILPSKYPVSWWATGEWIQNIC